ncbi:MAG: hypothetical protein JJT81_12375 [Rubellimicrobium sp.]|nr:hypothetical protein [Rubellimicrobium sp.]
MRLALPLTCLVLLPVVASAADCWVAARFHGKSAMSHEGYRFTDDHFADGMLICFEDGQGFVTGNDLPLVRFGESTLVGWGENSRGLEVVNTYQIDRERGKLLMTQSRIGTASEISILPDYAAVFVADVVRAD